VRAGASGLERVIVSSVANEYSGYVTTAAEYDEQNYEGAHTLYGPGTAAFLAAHSGRLAAAVVQRGTVQDVLPDRRFDLRIHRYLMTSDRAGAARAFTGAPSYVDPTATTDGYWRAEWLDVAPGDLAWHEPLAHIDVDDNGDDNDNDGDGDGDGDKGLDEKGGPVADDQGWDLQVAYLGAADHTHRYEVRWWDPPFHGTRRHRFVLPANAGRPEVSSEPFG